LNAIFTFWGTESAVFSVNRIQNNCAILQKCFRKSVPRTGSIPDQFTNTQQRNERVV